MKKTFVLCLILLFVFYVSGCNTQEGSKDKYEKVDMYFECSNEGNYHNVKEYGSGFCPEDGTPFIYCTVKIKHSFSNGEEQYFEQSISLNRKSEVFTLEADTKYDVLITYRIIDIWKVTENIESSTPDKDIILNILTSVDFANYSSDDVENIKNQCKENGIEIYDIKIKKSTNNNEYKENENTGLGDAAGVTVEDAGDIVYSIIS